MEDGLRKWVGRLAAVIQAKHDVSHFLRAPDLSMNVCAAWHIASAQATGSKSGSSIVQIL